MHGAKFERAGGDEEEGGLLVSFWGFFKDKIDLSRVLDSCGVLDLKFVWN